jgi:hypothetical protein
MKISTRFDALVIEAENEPENYVIRFFCKKIKSKLIVWQLFDD